MDLPITEKELDKIITTLKKSGEISIYKKLWCYQINYLNKNMEKK